MRGRANIFYPMLPRHIPKHGSPLDPYAHDLAILRAKGHAIVELCDFIHSRTGWKPGERAIYRQLAEMKGRST